MVDVRGDVLRPPHGTIPAAVKSNKNQTYSYHYLDKNSIWICRCQTAACWLFYTDKLGEFCLTEIPVFKTDSVKQMDR